MEDLLRGRSRDSRQQRAHRLPASGSTPASACSPAQRAVLTHHRACRCCRCAACAACSRRGPRPADEPVVAVSRTFLASPAARPDISRPTQQAGEDEAGAGDVAGAVSRTAQQQQPLFAAAGEPEQQQQPGPAGEHHAPNAAAAASPAGLLTGDELQQLAALLGSAPAPAPAASNQALPPAVSEHFQRTNARLGAFGRGLIDGLIAMEEAGEAAQAGCSCSWGMPAAAAPSLLRLQLTSSVRSALLQVLIGRAVGGLTACRRSLQHRQQARQQARCTLMLMQTPRR